VKITAKIEAVNILIRGPKEKYTVKDFDIYRIIIALLMRRWKQHWEPE
jgi:hypothetical protein